MLNLISIPCKLSESIRVQVPGNIFSYLYAVYKTLSLVNSMIQRRRLVLPAPGSPKINIVAWGGGGTAVDNHLEKADDLPILQRFRKQWMRQIDLVVQA